MHTFLRLGAAAIALGSSIVQAQSAFPSTLESHALLAAAAFIMPPADAPANLSVSGRYLHADGRRRDALGSIAGVAFLSDAKTPRPTGMNGPFDGQQVQGFSGIKWQKDGTAWVLSDNGYGSKANSPDAMLMFHHLRPDWKSGKIESVSTPSVPGAFNRTARRSRGFEGMAASPDGKFLYPMLEGLLWNTEAKAWESRDGKETLRILEFDVAQGACTGKQFRYALGQPGNNIGDFNLIDATTAFVIERDNGEGDAALACNGPARPDCFNVPARFKRVYKIDLSAPDAQGFVRKLGYVDLLDIADPKAVARIGGANGKFSFPQWCIEGVDVVDADHIVVLNDNNLGVSQGRAFGQNEPNEVILLRVPELLRAR